jgi:hypothetical protein
MLIHIHSWTTHTLAPRISHIVVHFVPPPPVRSGEGKIVLVRRIAVVWWGSARLNACSAFFALPFRRVKSSLALSVLRRFRSAAVFRAPSEGLVPDGWNQTRSTDVQDRRPPANGEIGPTMVKPNERTHDGNRQRCISCGHPRVEHRGLGCSVPKCVCVDYTGRLDVLARSAAPSKQ